MKNMNRLYGRGIDPMQKFWARLTPEDQSEFIMLRTKFLQNAKFASKDRRVVAFRNELIIALRYIEKRPDNIEMRSIMTGLSFCGPLIAVNNRQFKLFTGRCKSSINGSFQQLGYGAVKTKAKAKACVIDLLPSLSTEPQLLRQWTVRIATDAAPVCFVSCPKNIPIPAITDGDFYEEVKQASGNSDPSSCEGSPLQQKVESPHVEIAAAQKHQVHFKFNPPTFSRLVQPNAPQQQQVQFAGVQQDFGQFQQPQMQPQVRTPMHFNQISHTFISAQEDTFNDDSENDSPISPFSVPEQQNASLATSYSVDFFDDEDTDTNDFFDDFWCNSSIRKSKSEMFHPAWQDDILADLF